MGQGVNKKVKILIVDDEPDLCHVIAEQISIVCSDVSCDCSYSAEEAIELFRKNKYDILLSDIKMPKKNGLDLVKTVKNSLNQKIICLIMTGFSSFTEKQIKAAGASSLYRKPGDLPEMISEIEDWIKRIRSA